MGRYNTTYEADDEAFPAEGYRVKIKAYDGIAWRVLGWETECGDPNWQDENGEWFVDEEPGDVRTGRVVAIMVGDDTRFAFDPEDVTPIPREDFCGECGQIGCGHDGIDRSAE